MTLEIRPTDVPDHFDLYEGDDKIGELWNEPLDEEGIALGEPPVWEATIWSLMGTGKEWRESAESLDEIKQYAQEAYEEFVAERRELNRGARSGSMVSVPMGGQKGWRRR
ncbi:MAG: hypothetical protein LBV60_00805 [Streptomyces sp.]|jgi:hypothetical protein|nr:hypothetical protein [Streptomyces sp.]